MSGTLYFNNFKSMGTRFEMVIPGIDNYAAEELFQTVKSEVLRLDNKLSRFSETGIISEINHTASEKTLKLDKETFGILSLCLYYNKITSGTFDVTIYTVLELWKNKKPSLTEIRKVLRYTGVNNIELNNKNQTIHLKNPHIKIDLGGFGKGYALENVRKILKNFKIKNALVNFGDSSILAVGSHPHGKCWKIGIKDYYRKSEYIYSFDLKNSSLSTSGTITEDIKPKLHIINPDTGYPVRKMKTVSVVSGSPLKSEILSTALMIADNSKKAKILSDFPGVRIVEVDYVK